MQILIKRVLSKLAFLPVLGQSIARNFLRL